MSRASSASVLPKQLSDGGVVVFDSPLQGSLVLVAEQSVRNTKTSGMKHNNNMT
jgi:hypothetical protein